MDVRKSSGFTLIELMVVIAVIGVLAAIALPHFAEIRDRARRSRCHENSAYMTRVAEIIKTEKGRFPETMPELLPYVRGGTVPVCPFKDPRHSYGLAFPGNVAIGALVRCTLCGVADHLGKEYAPP